MEILRSGVKNCRECVNPKAIIEQFIQRDLFNATSLESITKWHIFEQTFTKSDLNTILTSPNSKKALDELNKIGKLQEIFPDVRISSIDDFINKITEKDVFETIFK